MRLNHNTHLSYEEMIDRGVETILNSFKKDQDLRSAVALVVSASSQWGADNMKRKSK